MSEQPAVVGLGQCSLDYLGRLTDYPAQDQKVELEEFLIQGGGPTATALVALARLGVATAFMGRVGDDAAGETIRAGLLAEGVDCKGLLADVGCTSQIAFCAADAAAGRTIFWHRGSARPLEVQNVDFDRIGGASVLLLDGLQVEDSLAA